MANRDAVCGLKPIYPILRANVYTAATGAAFYMYQPVDLDSNGRITFAAGKSGSYFVGSIIGILDDQYGPPWNAYSGYVPANPPAALGSGGVVYLVVADSPEQLFVIQEKSGGATQLTGADRNAVTDYHYYGSVTGSTVSGICDLELDVTAAAAGSTQQLRILQKLDKPDNDYGAYCKWIVMPYYHRYMKPQVGFTSV